MARDLDGLRVAVLASHGVDASELLEPCAELSRAGAEPVIVSTSTGTLSANRDGGLGRLVAVHAHVHFERAERYGALLLVGDIKGTDRMRADAQAVSFVREFFAQDKPVAALSHAVALVLEAEHVRGRQLTSCPSLKIDLDCAGARWRDQPAVVDGKLVTGRRREDARSFGRAVVKAWRRIPRSEWSPPRRGWWSRLLRP